MLKSQGDILSAADIDKLVRSFYTKAISDKAIGSFFTDAVTLDFDIHVPKIVQFWSNILLDTNEYRGNPMLKHIALNRIMKIQEMHFERWLTLWSESVDRLYAGPVADLAKTKARQIGGLMMLKIRQSERF